MLAGSKTGLESRPLCLSCLTATQEYTWCAIEPLCEKMTASTKTGITQEIPTHLYADRTTAVSNMHKNLVKFSHAVFKLWKRSDRQTNRHTRRNTLRPCNRYDDVDDDIYARRRPFYVRVHADCGRRSGR